MIWNLEEPTSRLFRIVLREAVCLDCWQKTCSAFHPLVIEGHVWLHHARSLSGQPSLAAAAGISLG
eukprot:5687953-Amphidinium_carterae.2